jgi:lipopolysaccharide/colanic/teichoic acid biosynthesis glycosyltransferase
MPLPFAAAPRGPAPVPPAGRAESAPLVRRPHGWYPPCRAAAEFLIALVLLVLGIPVIILAAVLVRLTSRGPAFYLQTRVGRAGRQYTIFKIRSMYHECERHSGPRLSAAGDPRITPVGRVLRRTHIDELPQLWHVLRGDMSLIGPRPERPEFVAKLAQDLPRYTERLTVRPGLTGLAQVQAPPDTDLDSSRRKLAYDLYYIEAMGPWLDLRIILSTALKVLGVSFPVLRKLFAMPTPDEVEDSYQAAPAAAAVTVEMQPA